MTQATADRANLLKELRALLSLRRTRSRADYHRMAHLSALLDEAGRDSALSGRETAELTALVSEYESVRQESTSTTTNRIQVMMLGLAGILALAGGALTALDSPHGSELILVAYCYAIPAVYAFVLVVWLSEAVRAHRAGYFLASSVEARINVLLERFALSWETSLWVTLMPRDEFLGPSMVSMGILAVIAAGCPLLGAYLAGWRFAFPGLPLWHVILPYVGFAVLGLYVMSLRNRLKNIPHVRSFEHLPADSVEVQRD